MHDSNIEWLDLIDSLLNVVLIIIITAQMRENMRANKHASRSVELAQQAIAQQDRFQRIEVQPYFKIDDNGAALSQKDVIWGIGIFINYQNVGRSPALNVRLSGVAWIGHKTDDKPIPQRESKSIIMPNGWLSTIIVLQPFNLSELDNLDKLGKTVILQIQIRYENIFEETYEYFEKSYLKSVSQLVREKKMSFSRADSPEPYFRKIETGG